MVKIRLKKLGKRNDHFFRIIAIDEGKKNGGEALETFGFWYPKLNESKVDRDLIALWVSKGAQVSSAVTKLLV